MKRVVAVQVVLAGLLAAPAYAATKVSGTGATFMAPLVKAWGDEYRASHPGVSFDYETGGSDSGVKGVSDQSADFGTSYAPMTDDELGAAKAEIIHLPAALGGVALAFNVPGVRHLNLSPEAVAGIFLGRIEKWNDKLIAADNKGVKLPNLAITSIHRSDESGTTLIFTQYLAKVSPEWRAGKGAAKAVNWLTGSDARGNVGVASLISNTNGSIGYVELQFAEEHSLTTAAIKNHAGKFVAPSAESVAAAADNVLLPPDLRTSLLDADGADSYPITSLAYLLLPRDSADAAKGKALAELAWYALHDGQKTAGRLHFAPLPAKMVKAAEPRARLLTTQGQPSLK